MFTPCESMASVLRRCVFATAVVFSRIPSMRVSIAFAFASCMFLMVCWWVASAATDASRVCLLDSVNAVMNDVMSGTATSGDFSRTTAFSSWKE